MDETRTTSQTIADEVSSWPGVEVDRDELGELAFKVGRREIGHLHGEHARTSASRSRCGPNSSSSGRIEPHPVFPDKRARRRAASPPTTTSAT